MAFYLTMSPGALDASRDRAQLDPGPAGTGLSSKPPAFPLRSSSEMVDSTGPDENQRQRSSLCSPARCRSIIVSGLMLALAAAAGAAPAIPTGRLVEGIACRADPTQTYTLYLPSTWSEERQWPALFVFDPRGRSVLAAEIFRNAAEEFGWVLLSSDNTRSDGPWEPNDRALRAMWPEPFERWGADPQRIYASGFSGGAIAALVLAEMTHQLAGVIGAGGRMPDGVPITERGYAHFGAAGLTDFNYQEMRKLDRFFEAHGNPHRHEVFAGRHQWLPPELARTGIAWLEIIAIRQGRRPPDPELVAEVLAEEMGAARELEAESRPLEALWRYEAIARTFEGLADLEPAAERLRVLAQEPGLERERRERREWNAWEERYEERLAAAFTRVRDPTSLLSTSRLADELGLRRLQAKAGRDGYEGVVARRILERIWTNTSFYLTRDLLSAGSWARALTVLTVALEIRDDSWFAWYNLACAAARTGAAERALAALERAVELGFSDAAHLASDPDLESLRGEPPFQRLLARLSTDPPS